MTKTPKTKKRRYLKAADNHVVKVESTPVQMTFTIYRKEIHRLLKEEEKRDGS